MKLLTDADFGIKNTGDNAENNPTDEPIIDAGDLGEKVVDEGDKNAVEDSGQVQPKGKLIAGKYKTITDAESGIKEAERQMHEANVRAARAEERLAAQVEKGTPTIDPIDAIADEAMAEIGKLNTEDEDYQKKTARIWARAQIKIAGLTVSDARRSENSNRTTEERVNFALKDAKLGSDNDKKIFWSIASHCPEGIRDLEGQITWAVERVREVKAEVAKEVAEEANRKKKEKGDLKVLGRTSGKISSHEEDDEIKPPLTLTEQLKASRRRI